MRIAFLTLSIRQSGGGSHQNAILFIRALEREGHEVRVHVFSTDNDPPQDISIQVIEENTSSFLRSVGRRAAEFARLEEECDAFLVYGHALLWSAGLYRKTGRRPVAVYLDSHLDSMKEQYRFPFAHRVKHRVWELLRGMSLARNVDLFLAASPYLKERFEKAGFSGEKFAVVPNAFDFSTPLPRAESSREIRILSVARLSYEKGIDVLISACAKLPAHVAWHVRIAGEGNERARIEEKIVQNRLSNNILLLGWQNSDSLAREYRLADILVAPSRVPEPFGRSVVEAMHAGLPVIVPDGGGAAWVADGAGITFKNEEADSLRDALVGLLNDSAKRYALGEKGRARARDFDARQIGSLLTRELEALERRTSAR